MKLWPLVALATMSSALVWACQGDDTTPDGGGGEGGEGTGGAATGGVDSTGGTTSSGGNGGPGGFGGSGDCESNVALGGWGGGGGAESSSILGDWTDQYGTPYSFDESSVDTGYAVYEIVEIDDAARYVVAHNEEDAAYFPDLYSRFEWHIACEQTYLCRSVLDAASADEAASRPGADRSDLTTGCSGFPWSLLTPQ